MALLLTLLLITTLPILPLPVHASTNALTPTGRRIPILLRNLDASPGGFDPPIVSASPGDILEFHFLKGNHSVALGDWDAPCSPAKSGGFFSGFQPTSDGENVCVFFPFLLFLCLFFLLTCFLLNPYLPVVTSSSTHLPTYLLTMLNSFFLLYTALLYPTPSVCFRSRPDFHFDFHFPLGPRSSPDPRPPTPTYTNRNIQILMR